MSIATTKKDVGWKKETVGSKTVRIVQNAAKAVRNDVFGILALIAVLIAGIGSLMGQVDLYWYALTLILTGLAYRKKNEN